MIMAFSVRGGGVGYSNNWASQLTFSGCVQGDWHPKAHRIILHNKDRLLPHVNFKNSTGHSCN